MTTPHRTLREAAQMALDALLIGYHRGTHDAIAALREALAAQPAPAEDFCYCDDDISLQMVSGGAALEGLYGRVTLKINGQYVDYVKAQPAPAEPVSREHAIALRDAELCGCEDMYFAARPQIDTLQARRIYAAGFKAGYEVRPLAQPLRAEPVALESVHLTRDIKGMCTVRVNGRVAIQDNGDIIDHMATLEWFAAPPAAPIPDGMVMVPREPTEEMIQAAAGAWGESESGLHNAFAAALRGGIAAAPAAPAAPVVREPLTDEQIWSMWMSSEFRGNGGQADWFCEGIRAAEAHHGITGGKP